nr:GrpB family protein [uncultured Pseudodesulfovibrio sp.]
METLEEKIERVLKDRIELVPYDSVWPSLFEMEKEHLFACLPIGLVVRIEHFGSTSIPGMTAKPVVDMLVEVTSLEEAKQRIAPVLEAQGYDYFWRPQSEGQTPPHYAWFIKRDKKGQRTHHIHMTVADSTLWRGLCFRDYLVAHPETAVEYEQLKQKLASTYHGDRVAYTEGKTEFVRKVSNAVLSNPS